VPVDESSKGEGPQHELMCGRNEFFNETIQIISHYYYQSLTFLIVTINKVIESINTINRVDLSISGMDLLLVQ